MALLTAPAEPGEPDRREIPRRLGTLPIEARILGKDGHGRKRDDQKADDLKRGSAQSRWKPANVIAPRWMPLNMMRNNLMMYRVTMMMTMMAARLGNEPRKASAMVESVDTTACTRVVADCRVQGNSPSTVVR